MKSFYHVYSPEGYVCIELAGSEYEAKQKAMRRPGYQPEDALRVEYYKPYIPAVGPAARDQIEKAKRRLEG